MKRRPGNVIIAVRRKKRVNQSQPGRHDRRTSLIEILTAQAINNLYMLP